MTKPRQMLIFTRHEPGGKVRRTVALTIVGLALQSQAVEFDYTYDENDRIVSVDEREAGAEYQYSDSDN
ncbi:MAG: hypothetical protein QME60_07205, partial [Verrucomicrobiota bacterium]|nr:hypothetical protein [Verrucomicrobiota bacterium]